MPRNIMIGTAFATFNAFMLAAMGLFAKMLSVHFGPIEVTFWRNSASLIFLLIWFLIIRQSGFWKTNRPYAHLFRSFIGTCGIILGMWTLALLPLAETSILLFTSPLFTVLLSAFILKEQVGPYRYAAVAMGFLGVAITAAPSDSFPLLGLIAGLGWGFFSGTVDVTLRWMGDTEKSGTTVFYFLLLSMLATGLYWPFSATPITNIALDTVLSITGIIAALGLTGTLALLAKTQSYRLAEASLIAPIMYTMLIWSIGFDYLIWDRIPGWNVFAGATLIIAANMVIILRERRAKKHSTQGTSR
ncbi:MAG: DMT family transporter [Bdellovibrionales bacterium]